MLTSGDVVELDLGSTEGREAGLRHAVVVVTAEETLDASANVIQVVPLTSTMRGFGSEVEVHADENNGWATIARIREVLAPILDIN